MFRSISVLDANQVTFFHNTIIVNPSVDFATSSNYYITVSSGAIRDVSGNAFGGISAPTILNFTTASALTPPPPPHDTSIYLSVLDNSIREGSSGTSTLSFGVNLTGAGAGTQTVLVQYATQDISGASAPATAGQDYIATSGVLVIPAGQTFGQIDVKVFGDTQLEPDEVFRLVLSQPSSGVTLLDASGHPASSIFATGFIDNDDQAPNHLPTGNYDLAITAPHTPTIIDVLSNDTDLDGDTLRIASGAGLDPFANSAGGTVSRTSDNKILFTPDSDFKGVFSYTYVLDDGHGGLRNVFSQVIVAGDGTPGSTNSGTINDDIIVGTGGNDTLSGGFGDDVIAGGPGADRIDGGPGFNYLDLRQATHGANIQFRDAWTWDDGDGGQDILTNIEGVFGSSFDDKIDGSSDNIQYITTGYRFYGNEGDDRLQSDAGDDILDGGPGDDILIFGSGRDIVYGGPGSDQIYSFNGSSDTISDVLDGGPGNDFIYSSLGNSPDVVTGGDGDDYIQFSNGDIVTGGSGSDTFFLGGFNSIIPYQATITDLAPGDTIKWQFPDSVVIDRVGYHFIGPITTGSGASTALDHVEFSSAGGETTLYFGFDSTPGADFILSLVGTFQLNQFHVDDSDFTLAINIEAAPEIIESAGSTSLSKVGSNYFLYPVGGSSGPELSYGGAPVVAGQFGAWVPIGTEATASGYKVAWKNGAADQYSVWLTDAGGNLTSVPASAVSGGSSLLQSFETSFNQDLNGDGSIGPPPPPPPVVVESFGVTDLDKVGSNYGLYAHGTTGGPLLRYAGSAVAAGQFGAWAPIGAEQTARGYEVAWKNGAADQYSEWLTDAGGNLTSVPASAVSSGSSLLQSFETSFNQDLNGDGSIGPPPPPPPVVVESFGVTDLDKVGSNYGLYAHGTTGGPLLRYAGSAVAAGQFGAWAPIGAEQTASGYEVAWKNGAADQYSEWLTDAGGNLTSVPASAVSGGSNLLQSFETSFNQDLNGDGSIGPPPPPPPVVVESFGVTDLDKVGSNYGLYAHGTTGGPLLRYAGSAVAAGQFGAWAPIGAEQTARGYEVAWKNGAADQYSEWLTDAGGNLTSVPASAVSGGSSLLQSFETSFNQDLNGDGSIGPPPPPPPVVVESFGVTDLDKVGSNYGLYAHGTTGGPLLRYAGSAVAAGQFGAWAPIGAEQTASGYEVAWKNGAADQYSEWLTDAGGNLTSVPASAVSGGSNLLQSFETSFNQDLNGDGITGPLIYTYITLDYPLASNTGAYRTNDTGQIIGKYSDSSGDHGFLYSAGTFSTLDDPLAINGDVTPNGTAALGINNTSQIVGRYIDASGYHGFLYSVGTYTTLNDPFAITVSPDGTSAFGINDSGQIVGRYIDNSGYHGFLYNGGVYTTLDDPLATQGTFPRDINASGEIVGYYIDGSGYHGFLYSGVYTTLDDPLATSGITMASGINDAGQVVGSYIDNNGSWHSFIYDGGTYTTLDNPSATEGTFAEDISNSGQIVGYYQTAGVAHGFLAIDPASSLIVDPGTTLEISSAYAGTVTFAGSTGTLKLDNSSTFIGTVAGMTGQDTIDLMDINFATAQTPVFSGDNTHGTLTVTDGTRTADLALLGNYLASSWTVSNDGHDGTNVVDPLLEVEGLAGTKSVGTDAYNVGTFAKTLIPNDEAFALSDFDKVQNWIQGLVPDVGAVQGTEIGQFDPSKDLIQFNPTLFVNYVSALAGAQQTGPDIAIASNLHDCSNLAHLAASWLNPANSKVA